MTTRSIATSRRLRRRCRDLAGKATGVALFAAGTLLTLTLFGAVVGVPMVVAGMGLITTDPDRC